MEFDAWMKDFSKGLDVADASNSNHTIQVSADTNLIGVGTGNKVDDVKIDQSQNNSTQQKAEAEVDDYGFGYKSGDDFAFASNENSTLQFSADTNLIGVGTGNKVDDVFIDQSQNNFTSQFAEAEVG
jgi:hypothetical protein